jgi:outer membrane protein assembly factor BamA
VSSHLRHILLFLYLAASTQISPLFGQSDTKPDYIIIDSISVQGNKKTRTFIIERELNFKQGDTIRHHQLEEIIRKTNNRLFNTALFLEAKLAFIGGDSIHKVCTVNIKERLFTYLVPIVGLADRNFNEWWVQRHHNLQRLEWGVYFLQKNMRGRNETLKIKAELGFVKKGEITYTIPYLTKSRKLGVILYAGFMLNKQVAYNTIGNKLQYVEGADNGFIRHRYNTSVTFTYRGSFYLTHLLGIGYNSNSIGDTVAILNPKYFLNGRQKEEFFNLMYSLIRDHRDIQYYPLKGSYLRLDFEQKGFGTNRYDICMTSLETEISVFRPIHKRFYFAGTLKSKYSGPTQQPYFNQRGLGYDKEYLSGYEQYVIDGQKYLLSKNQFKFKLFEWHAHIDEVKDERFSDIPLRVYLKTYFDMGYVWDNSHAPGNAGLSNKFLMSGGFGVDLVSYYDFVMRIEYSFNNNMQSGFVLNFKAAI